MYFEDLQNFVDGVNKTVGKDYPNKLVAVKHCGYGDKKPKYWITMTGKNERVGLGKETYDMSHSSYDPADAVSEIAFDMSRGRLGSFLNMSSDRKK